MYQNDLEAMAQVMFPSMRPAAAPAEAPERAATDTVASAEPAEPADGASEQAVPDDVFNGLVGTSVELDGEQVAVSEELARQAVADLREMATGLQLSKDDVAGVGEALTFAQWIRGDEQKTLAAREAVVELLNTEHGDSAALAARAAKAYVANNAKLARFLDRSGMGDAPQVVALIARRALALHTAGKLTVPGANRQPQLSAAQRFYASSGMRP